MKKINEVIETRIIEKRFKIFLKEKKKLLFSGLEAYLSNYYILEHIEKEISKVLKWFYSNIMESFILYFIKEIIFISMQCCICLQEATDPEKLFCCSN